MIREVTEKNSSQFLQLEHHQDSQSYLRASWSWVWHEIIKGKFFIFFLSFFFVLFVGGSLAPSALRNENLDDAAAAING